MYIVSSLHVCGMVESGSENIEEEEAHLSPSPTPFHEYLQPSLRALLTRHAPIINQQTNDLRIMQTSL